VDPSGVKIETRHADTFAELAAQYVREYATLRKKTWQEDQRVINVELHRWRHVKARDIKRRDVIAVLKTIADRPAPIQANRVQSLIRKIFNWAIGRDVIEANPCVGIVPFGKERRRTRVLTDEEIAQFWRAADCSWRASTDCPVGAILQLQLLTAQRGQEVRLMRWADIDLANGWWMVPAEFAKNGVATRVFLNRAAVTLLRES
jgi:integrase